MSNNVVIVDIDFQTVSTGPPFSMRQARIFPPPLPEWATVRPLWHLAHLPRARPPAFCGQHQLCLNIKVYCSCNTLLFAAWYAFLEPHKQKYSLKQLLQPQCTDFEEKVSSVWGTKLYIMLLFIMHLYNDLGSKLIQLSNLNYVCVPLVVHCAACCALYWRRWTQSTASCTLC